MLSCNCCGVQLPPSALGSALRPWRFCTACGAQLSPPNAVDDNGSAPHQSSSFLASSSVQPLPHDPKATSNPGIDEGRLTAECVAALQQAHDQLLHHDTQRAQLEALVVRLADDVRHKDSVIVSLQSRVEHLEQQVRTWSTTTQSTQQLETQRWHRAASQLEKLQGELILRPAVGVHHPSSSSSVTGSPLLDDTHASQLQQQARCGEILLLRRRLESLLVISK